MLLFQRPRDLRSDKPCSRTLLHDTLRYFACVYEFCVRIIRIFVSFDNKSCAFCSQGARFRDTSQQIHKQWQADPARAFPTVGGIATNSPSPASGELSTPNSTPSPSPSPTNQQITVSTSCKITSITSSRKMASFFPRSVVASMVSARSAC